MDMNQDFNFNNSNSSLLSFFKSYKSLSKEGQEIPTEVQNQEVQTIENREIRNHQDQNNMPENIHNSIPKHLIQEVQLQQQESNNNFNEPKSDHNEHVHRENMNHNNNRNNNVNIINNNQVIPQHNNQIQHTSFINGNLNNNNNTNTNNNNNNVINSMSTVNNQIIPTTIQNNNPNLVPNPNNQIVSDTCNLLTIPPSPSQNIKYVDITEFLSLPQTEAAKKLGLPVSTLSKRWKEAVKERKWPYRKVSKLDKEITTLLYNIPQSGPEAGKLGYETEQKLGRLLRLRQEELKPVVIRI